METLLLLYSFIFGALIGSFLNVVIFRLPDEDQSVVFPASHCPKCDTALHWYENIPIFSYLALRGKCKTCKVPISLQYPVVELCMALLSLALFNRFGFSPILPFYFLFLAALLVIIFIDIHLQIIPDKISLPGILIGFTSSFFNPLVSWQESGLGILLGGGILFGVAKSYSLFTKQEGMGGGDIKLLAMIGAFLGYQCLLFVIFFSSLTGSIVGIATMFQQKKGERLGFPMALFYP
ncbi:type 4 prepilin peptidase 1 Aspartic peptidase, MEROPS family A24A [Candidatus Electrothrix communis]|uniref:Prepilin leader peptidase/N-methyltransferase n=1 Tax=Candidatus Electrothrix communis TaxID=1859133 RepID=A0A3S4TF78_9BACT|nr:type 4 prepilin peptidase 1 Aspartic peptidase, MEROPS family A24A [Candidatus Electrothrix communis]